MLYNTFDRCQFQAPGGLFSLVKEDKFSDNQPILLDNQDADIDPLASTKLTEPLTRKLRPDDILEIPQGFLASFGWIVLEQKKDFSFVSIAFNGVVHITNRQRFVDKPRSV